MRLPSSVVFGLTLAVAACSDEPGGLSNRPESDPPPPWTSDARLRVRYATSGRFAQPVHLVDAELGQPCVVGRRTREPPAPRAACRPTAVAHAAYLDPACTDRIRDEQGNLTVTQYVAASDPSRPWQAAIGVDGAVRLGAEVSGGPVFLDDGRNGECFEAAEPTRVFEIAERLLPDQLPGGRIETRRIDDRLRGDVFVSERGLEVLLRRIDTLAGTECWPQTTDFGVRCATRDAGAALVDEGLWDTSCTERVAVSYSAPAVGPLTGDGEPLGYFRFVALPRDTLVARKNADGGCVPVEIALGRKTFFRAIPYPVTDWPALTPVSGDDRLVPIAYDNGALADVVDMTVWGRYFDRDLGVTCRPGSLEGTIKCVAFPPEDAMTFIDPYLGRTCAQPALALLRGAVPPPVAARATGSLGGAQGYLPVVDVYRVGVAVDRTAISVRDASGACRPVPPQWNADFYALEAGDPQRYAPLGIDLR